MTQPSLYRPPSNRYPDFVTRLVLALLCLFCMTSPMAPAAAGPVQIIRETGAWRPNDKIHAYLFDERECALRIIDEGNISAPRYGSLEKALQASGCLAGVNGGYFGADASGTPLGLLIENGKKISPFAGRSFTVAGVVYETGSAIRLVRSGVYADNPPAATQALQGGPFLVENARPVPGLHRDKVALRTFIATDGRGKWCIGTTSPMSLGELADWLAQPGTLPGMNVRVALNLDGGSSSAYWVGNPHCYYPSIKQVRNYLGIVRRAPRSTPR